MSKHTPGPWRIVRGHLTHCARGISADKRNIVNFNGLSSPTSEESQSNARLIAAAPDLLEALHMMLTYTADLNPMQGFDEHDHDAVKQARAAIKAAEEKA